MGLFNIFIISLGLAMDALAVSITVGLKSCDDRLQNALKAGIWFGGFQTGMTLIGWFLSSSFTKYIAAFGHWISFALLLLIGFNMLRDAFSKDEKLCEFHNLKKVLILAVAVSLDALAVGISFASLREKILIPSIIIGVVSLVLSMLGVVFGNLASKVKGLCEKADFVGGAILIFMGAKILFEHI